MVRPALREVLVVSMPPSEFRRLTLQQVLHLWLQPMSLVHWLVACLVVLPKAYQPVELWWR